MYDIEKGVPMPAGSGGWGKYPWRKMQVGDSFRVERSQMCPGRLPAFTTTFLRDQGVSPQGR